MREEGIGSDAGRPSLTEVGAGSARLSPPATCRLCGVGCAPGIRFCPNCGAIQRTDRGPVATRARVAGPLPPLPPVRASAPRQEAFPPAGVADQGLRPVPVAATLPGPVAPSGGALVGLRSDAGGAFAHGERLIGWSALGVLSIAAVLVVQRVGDLRSDAVPPPVSVQVAPAPVVAAAAPAPEPSLPPVPPPLTAEAALPTPLPTGTTIESARRAVKPAAKPKTQARRDRAFAAAPAAAPARSVPERSAPLPPPVRPEPILVAAAPSALATGTRWNAMEAEIAGCSTSDFLDGVMCQQRIRIRYCAGWWGQARECPSRRDDYGN